MALDSGTAGFLYSAGIAFAVGSVCFLLFSFLRSKFPNVYQFRRVISKWKSYNDHNGNRVGIPEIVPRSSPFAWISATIAADEDEIIQRIGLDTAMFLRFFRSLAISFSLLSCLGTLLLMPVYGTAANKLISKGNPEPVQGLRIVSLANVPDGDPRLWATWIMEVLSTIVILYFSCKDYARFAVLRRKYLCAEQPHNYALAVYDIPKECNNEEDIRQRFNVIVPGQVAHIVPVKANSRAVKFQAKLDTAVAARELTEWKKEKQLNGENPQHRTGFCGVLRCWQPKVDSLAYWQEEENRLRALISEESKKASSTLSAIIIFTNKRAASLLAQANMSDDSTQWSLEKAADPHATNWAVFKIPGYQAQVRKIGVFVFNIALTLLWTIPAFAIAGLMSLKSLSKNRAFSWARPLLDASPALTGLIEGLLPVVVVAVILSLIPVVMRLMVRLERIHSEHVVDRKTRDYFYLFTVYGSFFCVVLGSGILEVLKEFLDKPKKLPTLLAESIPGNGLFFANYISFQAGVGLGLLLLNPVRLILSSLFAKLAKTERQRRNAIVNGSIPQFFRLYGQAMLISFMGIMYTPLAPLVTICAGFFFTYGYLVHKYNLMYSLHARSDGGGESYPGAYWGTFIALMTRHIVVLVLLGLKRGAVTSALCVIPLLITLCVGLETARRYRKAATYGSIHDLFTESSRVDEIPSHYISVFEQPGINPETYQNLNGLETPDDINEDNDDKEAMTSTKEESPAKSTGV